MLCTQALKVQEPQVEKRTEKDVRMVHDIIEKEIEILRFLTLCMEWSKLLLHADAHAMFYSIVSETTQ